MTDLRIISADDHLQEARDLWEKRVPASLRDEAPHLIELPDGGHGWALPNGTTRPLGLDVMAGRSYEEYKASGVDWDEIRPGCYDPHARLSDMDIDGVHATVLYPNVGLFGFNDLRHDLAMACIRAYNDHLSEFCATDENRLIGVALTPALDPQSAVEEIERVGKLPGIRGALLPVFPGENSWWGDPEFEPLWAAAQANGLSISFHIGPPRGLAGETGKALRSRPGGTEAVINLLPMSTAEALATMLWSGVFDRYPELKVISVESGIGWLGYFRERAEEVYERHRQWAHTDLKEEPGNYFGRNIFATFESDAAGVQMRHLVGVETILWSSDYPHSDTTWPHSRENIDKHFKEAPDEDKRKIVFDNAARVYGIS